MPLLGLDAGELTSFAQCAISLWMNLPSCSGVIGATSVPIAANLSAISFFFTALMVFSESRFTTSFGVPAGAISANQAMSS